MNKFGANALLLVALLGPVILFWVLRSRSRLNGLVAAAVAVVMGWGLNVAWALASQGGSNDISSPMSGDTLSIALRFGWACPTVLVFITWLIWRFKARQKSREAEQ